MYTQISRSDLRTCYAIIFNIVLFVQQRVNKNNVESDYLKKKKTYYVHGTRHAANTNKPVLSDHHYILQMLNVLFVNALQRDFKISIIQCNQHAVIFDSNNLTR